MSNFVDEFNQSLANYFIDAFKLLPLLIGLMGLLFFVWTGIEAVIYFIQCKIEKKKKKPVKVKPYLVKRKV